MAAAQEWETSVVYQQPPNNYLVNAASLRPQLKLPLPLLLVSIRCSSQWLQVYKIYTKGLTFFHVLE